MATVLRTLKCHVVLDLASNVKGQLKVTDQRSALSGYPSQYGRALRVRRAPRFLPSFNSNKSARPHTYKMAPQNGISQNRCYTGDKHNDNDIAMIRHQGQAGDRAIFPVPYLVLALSFHQKFSAFFAGGQSVALFHNADDPASRVWIDMSFMRPSTTLHRQNIS